MTPSRMHARAQIFTPVPDNLLSRAVACARADLHAGAGLENCLSCMRARVQIFTPVPDNLLSKAMAEKETNTMLDARGGLDGLATPGGLTCACPSPPGPCTCAHMDTGLVLLPVPSSLNVLHGQWAPPEEGPAVSSMPDVCAGHRMPA
jgi:hypothetical protein